MSQSATVNIIVTHWEFRFFSGFSGELVSFRKLGQYHLLSTLQGHTVCMNHPMGPVCVGYSLVPRENQIPPKVGQDDLFEALKGKLESC